MKSSIGNSILVAALLLTLSPGAFAAGAEDTWAVAKEITRLSELLDGPRAVGERGDYLIANDRVRVIISAPDAPRGMALSGGHIIDADVVRRGPQKDELEQILPLLGEQPGFQAVYERVEVVDSGDFGRTASLKFIGHYSEDPDVAVETTYSLEPESSALAIRTVLTNNSSRSLWRFTLGDTLQWGYADNFVPGIGFDVDGRTTSTEWLAGQGEATAYAWTVGKGTVQATHHIGRTEAIVATRTLQAGESLEYERFLIVGQPDISEVFEPVAKMHGIPVALVEGTVEEHETGAPIEAAAVAAFDSDGDPVGYARTDSHGRFHLRVQAGEVRIAPKARGRNHSVGTTLTLAAGDERDATLYLSKPGQLKFNVFDESGNLGPAKLTFKGVGQTEDPDLGPAWSAAGAGNTVITVTGQGEAAVPPGDYNVFVSRGPEYNLFRGRVTVTGGLVTHFQATVLRAFSTSGWIPADLHVHADPSPDCQVSLKDRVASLVAEGVEFAVATDHNRVTDLSSTVEEMGLEEALLTSAGMEITTPDHGHFGVWPLLPSRDRDEKRGADYYDRSVREIYGITRTDPGDEVFQVNHPRAGDTGYFDRFNYDPRTGAAEREFFWQFDALEVWNGKNMDVFQTNLADWYGLLNSGFRSTATGCSGSHLIAGQEAGYPRTYIASREDSPDEASEGELVHALRRGYAFITNGPFIEFTANDKPMGEMIRTNRDGEVVLEIKVQAADWIDVTEVLIIENGEAISRLKVKPSLNPTRYEGSIKRMPQQDAWYLVMVRGEKSLDPVVLSGDDEPFTPLAFTNPAFVDVDGDGKFNAVRVTGGPYATPFRR